MKTTARNTFKIAMAFFAIAVLCPYFTLAQHDAPIRIELNGAKDQHDYDFAPADTNGVVVFYDAGQTAWDTTQWFFIHYDTNLVKQKQFSINLTAQSEFISYSKSDELLFLLFEKRQPKKDSARTFIITLDLKNNKHLVTDLSVLDNRYLTDIYAVPEHFVIRATGTKYDHVYFFDQDRNVLTVLNDIGDYKLNFCTADTANHRWLLGLNPSDNGVLGHLFLYEYDWLTSECAIIPLPKKLDDGNKLLIHTARAFPMNADSTLIVGTYNTFIDNYSSGLHSGVYTTILHHNMVDSVRLFNFTSLKSGTPASNKDNNLNLQLQVGRGTENGEQFTFVSEVFYPEYTYSYNSYYDDMRFNTPSTSTVFLGYRFVNAYLTTFDRNGRLLWDNYVLLDNTSIMHLAPVIHTDYLNDDILVYYPHNNRIINTLLNGYETLEKLSSFSIETSSPRDLIEYNRETDIQRWYGNNFLVSGYQSLRNRDKGSKGKRYVFFLNKVEYR